MKIGANDPCPCGSGLKYKKCCRNKDLESFSSEEHPPSTDTTLSEPALVWEPIPQRGPERYLSATETRKILKPAHKQYISNILSRLADIHSGSNCVQALELLEAIPRPDLFRLYGLLDMQVKALRRLDRHQEADDLHIEQLFRFDQEELWLEYGYILFQRISSDSSNPTPSETERERPSSVSKQASDPSNPTPLSETSDSSNVVSSPDQPTSQEKQELLQKIWAVCQRSTLLVPHLIWVCVVHPTDDSDIDEFTVLHRRALALERWRLFPQHIPDWLPLIKRAWCQITGWLCLAKRTKTAQSFVSMLQRIPWHVWSGGIPAIAIEQIGWILSKTERWDVLQSWLESMLDFSPAKAVIWTWLGVAAQKQGQYHRTTQAYREALCFPEQLHQDTIFSFLQHFVSQKDWESVEKALGFFENDDRVEVSHYRFFYYLTQNKYEQAMEIMDQICQRLTHDPKIWAHRWLLLESLQRNDQLAQELLDTLQQEPESAKGRLARAFMGVHDARHYRFEAGLKRLEQVSQEDVTSPVWDNQELWAHVLESRAICVQALGDEKSSLPWFLSALQAQPSEWRYHQSLITLIRLQRFPEAQELSQTAQAAYPNSQYLCYDRFLLAECHQRWDECWQCLEFLTLEFFRTAHLFKEGLFLFLRTLVYLHRWWDALLLCEEHLSFLLQHPELIEIRQTLLQDVKKQFHAMEQELGQRDQQLAQMKQQQQSLFATFEQTRRKHESLHQSMLQQEQLHREWQTKQRQPDTPKDVPNNVTATREEHAINEQLQRWQQERSDLFIPLPPDKQEILRSAEFLWLNFAAHTQQDHGPVILQLSRVVEGIVNQRLIDPLAQIVLQNQGLLQQLPSVSLGMIKPEQNRLSLGDAANLLFHRREVREADGSVSVEVNPQSSPQHREWLERLWQHCGLDITQPQWAEWCQHLPKQLRELARLRNRASHAGTPISREVAAPVRLLVLGTKPQEGLLASLLLLGSSS